MEYYMRVEGVNLEHFVYDTNNLPTIRGGGLALLNAVEKLCRELDKYCSTVETITAGASWGLFRLAPKNGNTVVAIKSRLVDYLNHDACLRHATFVIDIVPADNSSFIRKRNELTALNRWQQMQRPSLAIPAPDKDICRVCRIRPAHSTYRLNDEPVSASVYQRRLYGNDQKRRDFYLDRIALSGTTLDFTSDFKELSSSRERGNLHRKMAVIYIDGNKFGKFQEKYCRNEADQKQFDKVVRTGQNHILDALIREAVADHTGAWKTGNGKIRLETLLWGGDEIIWVVPAWLGLHVLDTFYQIAGNEFVFIEKRQIRKKANKKKKRCKPQFETRLHKLHHAAGLVFCHHNTPIHRVIRVAKGLAELAKDKSGNDLFAYQLLESFDHAGTNLSKWRSNRVDKLGNPDNLFINPGKLPKIISCIRKLKNVQSAEFPQRKLHQIIDALQNDRKNKALKLEGKFCEEHRKILDELKPVLGNSDVLWLHLVDLWDYTGE